jgi:hypothetical protein
MADRLNLSEINTFTQLLERTPTGAHVEALVKRLGLLTPSPQAERRAFRRDISKLINNQLSDEYGYWNGEFGRVTALIGILHGQEKELALQGKLVRSQERGRIRKAAEDHDPPIKKLPTQVTDEAEESAAVRDHEEEAKIVMLLLATTQADKEAITAYITACSREMSFRGAQMSAGIYA